MTIATTWGAWMLDRERLVLEYRDLAGYDYEVDLENCLTAAGALDWIAQVAGKRLFFTAEDVGELVHALDDLLYLQRRLCPGGDPATIDRADLPGIVDEAIGRAP